LRNDVYVPSISNKQKNFEVNDGNSRIRIRIRTKCHGSATLVGTFTCFIERRKTRREAGVKEPN
jgi:hypothetical protein